MWIFPRKNTLWQNVLNICHYDTCASESRPERVRLCVHTTEPTGPVPEPFHCDHIARWSARSGTTGRSGTGVNTGARLRSGTVPVPKLWCEHGLTNHEVPNDHYSYLHLFRYFCCASCFIHCAHIPCDIPFYQMTHTHLCNIFLAYKCN